MAPGSAKRVHRGDGIADPHLVEPLVDAMVGLLESNLNGTIDTLNATLTDDYTVPHAVQFLPFVPIP